MGRGAGFFLGLLGIIVPGFLFYIKWEFLVVFTSMIFQGFFYRFFYTSSASGETSTELILFDNEWLQPEPWGGNTEFYLYLAGFALAVLGIIVILASTRGGAFLLVLAGLANLGLMILMYSNIEAIFELSGVSGYPIPVGAIILILAGFFGMRD